jgi:predicted metal-dependent hydrolase
LNTAATGWAQAPYLRAYPPDTVARVLAMLERASVGDWLLGKYPQAHAVRTDGALYAYAQEIRQTSMRSAAAISKVAYDSKLQVIAHALGTHTRISRVQGAKLKTKHELRIASIFKSAPEDFLRMIVVHELAHLREKDHDKSFYQLCEHMEPRYHQLEFELRVYLTYLDAGGSSLWGR